MFSGDRGVPTFLAVSEGQPDVRCDGDVAGMRSPPRVWYGSPLPVSFSDSYRMDTACKYQSKGSGISEILRVPT